MTTLSTEAAEAVRLRDAAALDAEWERKIYQAGMVREIVSGHVDLIERLFQHAQQLEAERNVILEDNTRLRAQLEQAREEVEHWKRQSRANWDAARELTDAALKP